MIEMLSAVLQFPKTLFCLSGNTKNGSETHTHTTTTHKIYTLKKSVNNFPGALEMTLSDKQRWTTPCQKAVQVD